jgi:hypothetical protein
MQTSVHGEEEHVPFRTNFLHIRDDPWTWQWVQGRDLVEGLCRGGEHKANRTSCAMWHQDVSREDIAIGHKHNCHYEVIIKIDQS